MPRSMVGLLLAAVGAAVPVLVAGVHGSALIMLAVLAAGSAGGIYVLSSRKTASAEASVSSAQENACVASTPSALKKMPRTSQIIL
jgi:hypothetical protein